MSTTQSLRVRARRWSSRARTEARRLAMREARAVSDDRLIERPAFIVSSVRSGSTMLRVLLNTHSQLYAPHELHLKDLDVKVRTKYARAAIRELGLNPEQLQFLLWDRALHRELMKSGKRQLVEKTPSNVFIWRKVVRCWPDAKFVFLLRHPAAITESWARAQRNAPPDKVVRHVRRYVTAVERARRAHGGLVVRYEDLTAEPERELRRICDYLDVEFEPAMLDYGAGAHGTFRAGIGDWSNKLKSGRVQPAGAPPARDQIASELLPIAKAWGYLD